MIETAWVESVAAQLPELPDQRRARYVSTYSLSEYDAATLTSSRAASDYFEAVLAAFGAAAGPARAKSAANWVMVDLAAALNRDGLEPTASPVRPAQLARLIERIEDGTISGKIGRELFAILWTEPSPEADAPDRLIDARGLRQISDSGELEAMVDAVIAAHPKSVEEFRAGKEKAFNALVGQVMKASRGKANPQQVNDLLRRKLGD